MQPNQTHDRDRLRRQELPGGVWLRQTKAFTVRYARELFRSKAVLFWTIGFPVGFYLITIAVMIPDEAMGANEGAIKASIAVSYGMFGAIIAALNSFCEQLGADLSDDRYQQFRSLSVAPTADLAGRLSAGLALVVVAFLLVLPVAVLTGATFSLASAATPLVVALALVTFGVFWMVVAIGVALVVRNERYASIITVSLALVAYMLTGFNGTDVSAYHGPDWLLNVMPHTLATRLISAQLVAETSGMTPPSVPEPAAGLGLLAVTAIGSLAVGTVLVRTVLYNRGVIR